MSRTALTLTTAVLTALLAPRLAAQAAPEPGSVVRAYVQQPAPSRFQPAPPPDRVDGKFIALDSTRLVLLRENGDTLTVPLGTLRQLDLRGGRTTHALKGALIGTIIGGVVGVVIGSQQEVIERCEGTFCLTSDGIVAGGVVLDTTTAAGAGLTTGALIGGLAGVILGATLHSYHWTPVGTGQLHLGVLPAGRGMRVGLSAAF